VNSSALLFSLEKPSEKDTFRLVQKSKWNKGMLLTSVVSRGDILAVADAMRSVQLAKLEGEKLVRVAANYSPLWPVGIQYVSDNLVICGELDQNISLFKRDGANLERIGGIHYGELAGKFIYGSISPVPPHASVQPRLLTVTSTGRISVISEVDDQASLRLTQVQRNMGYVKHGPAGAELSSWRTPRTARPKQTGTFAGFIDGDFVAAFLDLPDEQTDEVLKGKNQFERLHGTKQDIMEIVEQVSALQ